MRRNFLPQDTRSTEILSALSLLFLCLFLYTSVINPESYKFIIHQGIEFWLVLFAAFGSLQFSSLILYHKAELLRVIMSWVNGSIWIWLSLQSSLGGFDICAFFFGIGNMYAFCINFLLLRRQWVN